MASFTDLVKSPEFAQSSQPKRKQMFDDWKVTNLDPILAEQPASTRIQADQKLQQVFDRISPAPEGEFFGDIGTSFSAGVDTAQAIGAEIGVQAAELGRDYFGRGYSTSDLRAISEGDEPWYVTARSLSEQLSDYMREVSTSNQEEAKETREGLSDLAQDKQVTLKELQDVADSDFEEAVLTAGFYLAPANWDALLNLSVESGPSTAAAVGATVVGGVVGGPVGAGAAAIVAEGAMGAGEASMGAYNTAYQELKKQGLGDEEASAEALRISRTAAAIGGAASAALGKLGDAGVVAKQFGKGATKEAIDQAVKRTVGQQAKRVLGATVGVAKPLVGEGLQGAAVQIAENIAVDEVVETPWNEGAITAGVTEALASGPTTAAVTGTGAVARRIGERRAKDPARIAAAEQATLDAEQALTEQELEVEIDVAMDRADEILRTQQPTIEIEDELDAQSTADQEKDRQAEAVTLDQELDSTALTGGLDSTGSDLPTEQPTSTDEDTGSPDTTATANDSQGTATTQSEDGVLGGGESAAAPTTTGPAQQTETAAPGAGDGTATDGQESGPADSTGVDTDQGATPSGSTEQQGSDSESADIVTADDTIDTPEPTPEPTPNTRPLTDDEKELADLMASTGASGDTVLTKLEPRQSDSAAEFFEGITAEANGSLMDSGDITASLIDQPWLSDDLKVVAKSIQAVIARTGQPLLTHFQPTRAREGSYFTSAGTTGGSKKSLGRLVTMRHPADTYDGTTNPEQMEERFAEVLLHEMLHAVTAENRLRYVQTDGSDFANEMHRIYELVGVHVNGLDSEARKAFPLFATDNNALQNPSELLSWGMTNREAREYLSSIPDPDGGTVWDAFVETMRKLLGLSNKQATALESLMQAYSDFADAPSTLDQSPTTTGPTDARSVPDTENVAVQWADMLEDVVDGEIVAPELSYADLTEEGKLFWKQAVEDGYGSAARAEEIMRTELRNGTTPRTAPATDVSQYTPQVIQEIRSGVVSDNQTTGATASLTNPNTMPVIMDRGTTQPALPVNTVAAPDTLEGAAGAINAAIKASNKQSGKPAQNGSYMIADPANGVAHIMTRAGSLVRTVPFASIDIAAPVHTVNTPDGAVGYQRVQVKKKNQVRKTRNGNPDVYHYDGIAYPTTMDASLKPAGGGFSGIVYIAKDALPENRVAPNIPLGQQCEHR